MGKIRRESGETSVFRRKTLAQGRFTRPEQVESKGFPQSRETLWEKFAGSPARQAFFEEKPWRRGDSLAPSKWNQKGSRKVGRLYGTIKTGGTQNGIKSIFYRLSNQP